ncbi:MAG: redoxin family protein, partial [Planctomycetaceae bacterium]|nr:redoxin family protein [Planctomycetaceae bacterium]
AATNAFPQSDVLFVAVNLQETSDQVRTFLQEKSLDCAVALDRSGSVAAQFGVSGIPHTVVLGHGGIVEKIKVGYHPQAGKDLEQAIQQMLDGTWNREQTSPSTNQPMRD